MDNKGKIQRSINSLQRIKTWQLVVVLVLFGFIAATFLRLNSIGMVQRREAVLAADKEGSAEKVHQRLYDLQHYVSTHMNTDLGRGVYLEASYNRDIQRWQEQRYGDANPNGNIYKKAQEVCAPQFSSWSQAYIHCTTNELAKYPSAEEINSDETKPRQEAYIHSFSAPVWSADFAGWSVLLVGVIGLLILIRLIAYGVLKILVNRHYRRI